MSDKKLVDVTAEHTRDGKVKPLSITWEDGRVYSVDRVLDVRMAAALKAGARAYATFAGSMGEKSSCSAMKVAGLLKVEGHIIDVAFYLCSVRGGNRI